MIILSVNLNKIALLRNSREGNYPDLLSYAKMAIEAGAGGITVHPRPDQRHIRPSDLGNLKSFLKQFPAIELNIEGNPFAAAHDDYPGFMRLIEQFTPHQCTLVPDSETQLTSDHGFDLIKEGKPLKPIIEKLKNLGVRISLFMDPDLDQISEAAQLNVERIELYTGPFAEACRHSLEDTAAKNLFEQHCRAAKHANELGLGINAGHDLNLKNLPLYRKLPHLQEVSIGHALTVDSIEMGFVKTVKTYYSVLNP
jgi:pyridoxine 5-phosphate synthase